MFPVCFRVQSGETPAVHMYPRKPLRPSQTCSSEGSGLFQGACLPLPEWPWGACGIPLIFFFIVFK